MSQPLTVSPGTAIKLSDFDTRYVEGDIDKKEGRDQTQDNLSLIHI